MLVMEMAAGGDLLEYINRKLRLNENEACKMFHQIVDGVEYCHRKKIVHRDLKLENILLNKDLQIKIADFGLSNSIKFGQKMGTPCGTLHYQSPEQVSRFFSLYIKLILFTVGYLSDFPSLLCSLLLCFLAFILRFVGVSSWVQKVIFGAWE